MDTADGLAVPDASRRLAVMADSRMGAFWRNGSDCFSAAKGAGAGGLW